MTLTELLNSDMTTLSREARRGLEWWLRELRAMLPGQLGGAREQLGAVHRLGPGDRIIAASSASHTADTLVIPGDICLERSLALPAMREADLRALVELDADRILPVAPSSLVIGVQPGGPSAAQAGMIDVVVGALPLERAQRIAAQLAEVGLAPRRIGPLDETGERLAFDLAPAMRAAGLLPPRQRVAPFWWGAVAALVLLNIGVAVLQDQRQVNRAQELVDAQAPALNVVRRIEDRLRDNAAKVSNLAARRERQQPQRVLARLSAVMPKASWIQHFEWDGTQIRVSGYAAKGVNVIASIKASGAFARVRASRSEALAETAAGAPFDFSAALPENP